MKNLLFLAHRIPYPPNKGDKIRSFHFLEGLSENYNVHLGAFIDDPEDNAYIDKVNEFTSSSFFINLNPTLAKVKSLLGFLKSQPLTLPYYKNASMQQWVDELINEKKIDKIFIFSSAMAQYVDHINDQDIIIDFVDVDSDKWLQYAKKKQWPMSWVYSREGRRLLEFDSEVAKLAKKSLFVSEQESKLFETLVDLDEKKIDYVNNGVDIEYFQNNTHYDNPYQNENKVIVFTGAMDYWANIDAVIWFTKEVLPYIQEQQTVAFYIVGSNPSKEVMSLADNTDVFVSGRVEDIRPYIKHADVIVAPLLIARGIQNKVLEAMAMGKTVVATSQAIEGINIEKQQVYIEDQPDNFSNKVLEILNNDQETFNVVENRLFVEKEFSWVASLTKLKNIIN